MVVAARLTDGVVELRPPLERDADEVFAACQDLEISRFTAIPSPYERGHAEEWITRSRHEWEAGTAAPMVIVDAATGELVGSCALLEFRDGCCEIGYWVKREVRDRGIAARAVRLLTDWGLHEAGLRRVELLADLRNTPSHRVAEKAGYRRDGEVPPPERCAGRCGTMARFVREQAAPQ